MSVIQGNSHSGSGYSIANSLRLRSSASAYLSRTPASAGNRTTWTWAGWVKRGTVTSAASQRLFAVDSSPSGNPSGVFISSTDTVNVVFADDSGTNNRGTAFTGALRDPSAWYHLVVACDTSQALDVDKIKLFVNGSQFSGSAYVTGYPTLSMQGHINMARLHTIGQLAAGIQFFDGYLSDVYFIDGQALDPNGFGNVDAATGQWIPKKYTGTYGTNGFYLPFNDGSNLTNLCLDHSGNGNNWTASGISLTAGSTYDWMDDTPTNNFAVLNSLVPLASGVSISNGSLRASIGSPAGIKTVQASMAFPSSGKSYVEFLSNSSSDAASGIGFGFFVGAARYGFRASDTGWLEANGSTTASGLSIVIGGQTFQLAHDPSTGKAWIGRNNAWFDSAGGTTGNPSTGANPTFTLPAGECFAYILGDVTTTITFDANFGQQPFAYTPPAGFKALCTNNLPTPSILNPKKHFDVKLWTGNGAASRDISGLLFGPDLVWPKCRSQAYEAVITDSVRGAGKALVPSRTNAELANGVNGYISAFNFDGFTVVPGSSSTLSINAPLENYVSWLWKAGGAPVTNNAGSIQSQVSANPQAGFSIVTYTGTGANATVGHGLGVAPKMVIAKTRSIGSYDWCVHHANLTSASYYLSLSGTISQTLSTDVWNATAPTSSVVSIGTSVATNQNAQTLVMYCFAEIPGFSKIGSYTGNGSSDGPFVYCGFRPRFVMVKCSSTAGVEWVIHDSARSPKNIADQRLIANISDAEYGSDGFGIDILSNGFKARTANGNWNSSGQTYIFYAIAEYPFNYSTAR